MVDRLLASPRYAEQQAMHWLDAVRYADTCGFHGDNPFPAWPYRDYVLRAFRDNKPFDEFTREQLAGDLMPNATSEQKVASAYNRLNRTSAEGGLQPKEYLAKYGADRVRTLSAVWLGSTMGCAECHDHKFDPFKSKDFYSMKAFFADIKETGWCRIEARRRGARSSSLPNEEQRAQLAQLDAQAGRGEAKSGREGAGFCWRASSRLGEGCCSARYQGGPARLALSASGFRRTPPTARSSPSTTTSRSRASYYMSDLAGDRAAARATAWWWPAGRIRIRKLTP